MNTVQIQVPNTDQTLSGLLIGVDKATMRFRAQVEQCLECLRENMTAQAVLVVGGAPRQLWVQIADVSGNVLTFTPISSATPYERRERKRYPVNLQGRVRYDEADLFVKVVNISVTGLGLHAPQPFAKEQRFEIELSLLSGEQAMRATAEVRHSRPLNDGRWYIGAAFVELSRTDALWLRKLFP